MPRYGDDQCEECGGVRVAGSKLCVDCLVKERDFLEKEVLIKKMVIEVKKKRIKSLQGLLKELMVYGFKQNQENAKLKRHVIEIQREIERGINNGEDRETEDTGL